MVLKTIESLLLQVNGNRKYWEENWVSLEETAKAILYGYRITKYSSTRYSNLSKIVFPDKTKGTSLKIFLLGMFDTKHCSSCDTVLDISNFRKNKAKADGVNSQCKFCHSLNSGKTQAHRSAKYRSSKLKATPNWADLEKISKFYFNCPEGYHVDHIVPLQGSLVCGLHVLNNLQYLTALDNLKKHNKHIIL